MIHTRDHTPFLEHRGFSIRPGTETTIGIREVWGRGGKQRRAGLPRPCPALGSEGGQMELNPSPQDEVHRLGSPYSDCTDSGEGVDVPLLYNATYTRQVRPGSGWGSGWERAGEGGGR